MKSQSLIMTLFAILTFVIQVHADVTVETIGYGATENQAKNDALRNAVEQAAGVKMFSESIFKDFRVLKDVVITEAFGLITGYTVIETKRHEKDTWKVKIRANVSKDIDSKWAKIKVAIEQKGNPSIMFCIKETIDDNETAAPVSEYQLVQSFKGLGFRVIDRDWSEKLRDLHKKIYSMDKDLDQVIAVASQMGADLAVIGVVEASFTGEKELVGDIEGISHSYSFRTKVIRTDTAQVIGSLTKTYNADYPLVAYSRESAAKAGFSEIISEKYIQPMIVDILKTWIEEMLPGTTTILVVSGVPFNMKDRVVDALLKTPDLVTSVRVEHYRNKRLELVIRTNLTPEEVAKRMEKIQGLPLEVIELKKNWLEVGVKEKDEG